MDTKVTNLMLEILEKYTDFSEETLYPRKISILINKSHRSVGICLRKMEDLKLLNSKKTGKEIQYYLNFNSSIIIPFLCLLKLKSLSVLLTFLSSPTVSPVFINCSYFLLLILYSAITL